MALVEAKESQASSFEERKYWKEPRGIHDHLLLNQGHRTGDIGGKSKSSDSKHTALLETSTWPCSSCPIYHKRSPRT